MIVVSYHLSMLVVLCLYRLSEWRFGDTSDSSTVYTFLYDTFRLQLVYEDASGAV